MLLINYGGDLNSLNANLKTPLGFGNKRTL